MEIGKYGNWNIWKYILKRSFIFTFILLISLSGFGQNSFLASPEFNIRRGFILPHHKSIQYLVKGYITSYEADMSFRSDTAEIWQIAHKFPTAGIGVMYSDFNNPEILGKSFSSFFYYRQPILQRNRLEINYKFAQGISYLTKKFDPKKRSLALVPK